MVTADELGNQGMSIQSLSFNAGSASDPEGSYNNFVILMGHTELASLTDTFDNNWTTSGTEIFSDPTMELTGIVGDQWFTFVFPESFQYNGTSNLLMELVWDGPALRSGSIYSWCWVASSNRTVSSNDASSPTGMAGAICQQLMLDYEMDLNQMTFAGIKNSF